jgi:SET domain-containing protein
MTLRVNTYIAKSEIEGLGLFAAQDIPKGTIVWQHDPIIEGYITINQFSTVHDQIVIDYVRKYFCYDDKESAWIRTIDSAKYMNHSSTPNLNSVTKYLDIADRDILKGEELTVDYRKICDILKEIYNEDNFNSTI